MASQLLEEVTAYAQSDGLEDAREICADGSYFPNNLRIIGCQACMQCVVLRIGCWFEVTEVKSSSSEN